MPSNASFMTTIKLTSRSAYLPLLIFFVFFLIANFVKCGGKEENQAIIDDLIKGHRCILGLGQTYKRMVVVIGKKYEEDNADNLYIYDMPNSSFQLNQPVMELSNGSLASKIWPAFYRAVKGRTFGNTTVTLMGDKNDYLFVIFQRPTSVLLYNIDTKKVEKSYNGMNAISQILTDLDWGYKGTYFTGISMETVRGFKSYTYSVTCKDDKPEKCFPVTRYTMWKCDGSSQNSGLSDLACDNFVRDFYFSFCIDFNKCYMIDGCNDSAYQPDNDIRTGFTVHFKQSNIETAGFMYYVREKSRAIGYMQTCDCILPKGIGWTPGEYKYYQFSDFFQAGLDSGRSRVLDSVSLGFTIMFLVLLVLACCFAGFFCCCHRKKLPKKMVVGKMITVDLQKTSSGKKNKKRSSLKHGNHSSSKQTLKRRSTKCTVKKGGSKKHHPHVKNTIKHAHH